MVTTQTVQTEIEEIQAFIDQMPVVEETLRKAPRVIGVVGEDIDAFEEHIRAEFDHDEAAHVRSRSDEADEKFISLVHVEETETEREEGETVSLDKRPLNTDEIQNLDEQLRENPDFHADGLTQELLEDLERYQIKTE